VSQRRGGILKYAADQADQDDEDYDAAEIDKELIASRLQHDVVSLVHRPK
jgi:hypothetical protein